MSEPSPLTPREAAALTIEYALWRRERGLETRSTMPDAATEYVTMPPAVVPAWLVIPGAGVEVQGWTCRHCRVFVAGGAEEIEHGEYCPAREGSKG